ncbi:MAG TPA: alpha-amylase family glycosyl hydrolase, partial [Lacipirellulaceae bacterium]|nr:alpha-amylase family glycosyl hydrolase [Lacipirellulaceae bacterium]
IDGWRLDVANEVPLQFWRDWYRLVRQLNPEAYTVAEIWDDARDFLAEGGFSATMNYHGFSYLAKGFLIDGRLSAHDFGRELLARAAAYPPAMQFALQNLIGSHDTDRLASMIVNRPDDQPYLQPERFDYDVSPRVSPRHDKTYQVRSPTPEERRLQRMVVLLQMTTVGPPMVYYGDEAGMWGADDPCDRKPMVWDDLQYEPQAADPWGRRRDPDDVQFDDQLHDFYRRAIALRNSHPVLRRGGAHMVDYDDDRQFLALARTSPEATAIVAFNRGSAQHRWELPDELAAGAWRLALATDDDAALDSRNGAAAVVLPPHSALVLLRPGAGLRGRRFVAS